MVRKFTDIKQIADQPAHHLAGIVSIIIGKGQAFILIEQFLAHVPLHHGTHDMSLRGHIIFAQRPYRIHHQQDHQQYHDGIFDLLCTFQIQRGIQIIQDLRKSQVDDADAHRADHIEQKYFPVWTIIPDKFSHDLHMSTPFTGRYYTMIHASVPLK